MPKSKAATTFSGLWCRKKIHNFFFDITYRLFHRRTNITNYPVIPLIPGNFDNDLLIAISIFSSSSSSSKFNMGMSSVDFRSGFDFASDFDFGVDFSFALEADFFFVFEVDFDSEMDSDGFVKIFSSCFLDIFS